MGGLAAVCAPPLTGEGREEHTDPPSRSRDRSGGERTATRPVPPAPRAAAGGVLRALGGCPSSEGGLLALGGGSRSPRGGSRSPRTRRCPAPAASPRRRRRHRLSKRNLSGPGQSQTGPATQPMAAETSESRPMGEPPAACRPMGALYSNGPHLYQRNVGSSQAQVECPVLVPPRRGQPGPPHQALPVAVLPPGAVATPRPACQAPRGPVAPLRGRRVMGRPSRRPRGARL